MTQESNNSNTLYPIFLKLEKMHVLLVGGGNVALEKLESLLKNAPSTQITIVAPLIRQGVRDFVESYPQVKIIEQPFTPNLLDNIDIIVGATDNPDLHKELVHLAKTKRIWVNIADTPDLCDFYLGSIVRKGHLKIAISTNGKSPTAAKRLRELLEDALPAELNEVLLNLNKLRDQLKGDFQEKVKQLNQVTSLLYKQRKTNVD